MSNAWHNNNVPLDHYENFPGFAPKQSIDRVHSHLIAFRSAMFWYRRNYPQIKTRAQGGDILFQEVISAQDAALSQDNTKEADFIRQCAVLCGAYGDVIGVTIVREDEPQQPEK